MTGDKANFDGLAAAALQHHRAGRLAEAEAAYRAALQLVPGHPAVAHNLGAVAATRGDPESAIGWFDVALAAEPGYASALFNKAIALQTLGRMQAAIACLKRTCALEPEHYQAHLRLALLWLAEGERGRALDHFARTYELRRGEDRSGLAGRSLSHATRGKLLHDADQFRYLASRRRDGQRFEVLARLYEDVARGLPDGVAELSPAQLDVLGEDYNSGIHLADAAEIRGPAVNPALDVNAIERAFRDGGAGAAAVDDLLTPDALASLKRYLLESTIWHDFSHIGGFVASYLEDGLASPLVLQIADELRRALPDLLGPHPLSQAWAFKGLEARSEVDAHADDAVVSVNLWLT
ncbi:MAG: tetratricopeptide repeat protein, partial [Hyphomicrobiaceae bacterium]